MKLTKEQQQLVDEYFDGDPCHACHLLVINALYELHKKGIIELRPNMPVPSTATMALLAKMAQVNFPFDQELAKEISAHYLYGGYISNIPNLN